MKELKYIVQYVDFPESKRTVEADVFWSLLKQKEAAGKNYALYIYMEGLPTYIQEHLRGQARVVYNGYVLMLYSDMRAFLDYYWHRRFSKKFEEQFCGVKAILGI